VDAVLDPHREVADVSSGEVPVIEQSILKTPSGSRR